MHIFTKFMVSGLKTWLFMWGCINVEEDILYNIYPETPPPLPHKNKKKRPPPNEERIITFVQLKSKFNGWYS